VRPRLSIAIFAIVSALTACGGGDKITGPTTGPTYDSIAGTYTGEVAGFQERLLLHSTFTLTIAQSDASFSGTYGLSGFLNDSTGAARKVSAAGSLTGTMNPGSFPSLGMTLLAPGCPDYRAVFRGVYDSLNDRIIISGPIDFFADNTCNVVLTYPSAIVLNR